MENSLPNEKLDRNDFVSWQYKMHQYLIHTHNTHTANLFPHYIITYLIVYMVEKLFGSLI